MATKARSDGLEQQLENLLEVGSSRPPRTFRPPGADQGRIPLRGGGARPGRFSGPARRVSSWTGSKEPTGALDESDAPFYKWFADGKLNVSYNCVDRHVEAGNGDRVAFHWRGEEGEEREITYAELHRDVQRFANALKDRGIGKGDVVGIYLPMIPEVVSRCSPARASALPTTSSSAGSHRWPYGSGWSSPRRRP